MIEATDTTKNRGGNEIEIFKEIKSGGYGKVYNGRMNGITVAIKVQFQGNKATDEWNTMKQIHDINVIGGLYTFNVHPYSYIVMDKADCDLPQYIKSYGPIKDHTVYAGICCQILLGIEQLHALGLIHRDLKPMNILVFRNIFKICDFGLVVRADRRHSKSAGTCPYMAPEVLLQVTYDLQADIWSAGCIFYYLRTGGRPFKYDSCRKVLRDIVSKLPLSKNMEKKVKQYFKNKPVKNFVTYPTIFLKLDVYYRHQNFILKCLTCDPDLRPSVKELFGNIIFRKLTKNDFSQIPFARFS